MRLEKKKEKKNHIEIVDICFSCEHGVVWRAASMPVNIKSERTVRAKC